jgi:geranylgeranyl diphosphate synthase type I
MGGGAPAQVEALAQFGRKIGTAFQILNDVNNLTGGERLQGRSPWTDLKTHKCTLLLAYAMQVSTDDTKRHLQTLLRAVPTEQTTQQLQHVLVSLGAHTHGEALAHDLLTEAKQHLQELPPTRAVAILSRVAAQGPFRRFVF